MLKTTQTTCSKISSVMQEINFSAEVIKIDWFPPQNQALHSDAMDSETKQQILQSLLFRIRQISSIRRLSVTKLKG